MKSISTLLLLIPSIFIYSQTPPLRLNPNIVMLRDSTESKTLTDAVNGFLISADKPNEENSFVYESEKVETFILLDEIKRIQKSQKFKDDFFYKPYLTNLVKLADEEYLVQVSYIGTKDSIAYLRASFEFVAHKSKLSFTFSSLLVRNTQNWKIEKIGNYTFHYRDSINKQKAKEYSLLASSYDLKLKSNNRITDLYCTNSITELQRLIGVQYKADYNGRTQSVWSASSGNKGLIVLGNKNSSFEEFDPHDLFHDRLSLIVSRRKVNRPVDEGCAYLYGGSWGLSWKEIFQAFKEQIANDTSTNWMEIKEKPIYFKTVGFNNSADYIVNALLIQKIEREKGFSGVWQLLTTGPYEKGNEKYYLMLEKLTGITKTNYNEQVWELINNEK